jgi:formylglycine-generating enzyme required for sulfatase activity
VRPHDERHRQDNLVPFDVAGYVAADPRGQPADRYAVLWVERAGPEDEARLYVGATDANQMTVSDRLKESRLIPRTLQAMRGADGRTRYNGVWGRSASNPGWQLQWNQTEAGFRRNELVQGDKNLVDVAVSGAEPARTTRERARASLEIADKDLKAKPEDPNHRWARALALIGLGEDRNALDDLGVVIEKSPQFVSARQHRALVNARLGLKKEALDDLAQFQKGTAAEGARLYIAAVVAAELGEGQDEAFARLEAALKGRPGDPGLAYDAACAYALASRAMSRPGRAGGQGQAGRAIELLRAATADGYSDYDHMREDSDLDPIRDLPAFGELMKPGHPDRRYAAVWTSDPRSEGTASFGLDSEGHLRRCRELAVQGYRPVSLSASRTTPDGPPATASAWHRPMVSEPTRDELAERQARAAVALVRLGQAGEVWPLLRHGADPQLRSFIVNWLEPLGADPKTIVTALDRPDSSPRPAPRGEGGRRPGEGSSMPTVAVGGSLGPVPPTTNAMDAILFHPETSMRRALILSCGTYGTEALSPGEREPLIARLLDVYEHDPDAGIHGAAAWTLRQWKQQAKLEAVHARLRGKDRGDRRWYVNGQGQTFAIVEGPVEFRMGSPPSEPDRVDNETPRQQRITRRFAIADAEVTVRDFQRFVSAATENQPFLIAQNSLDRYSAADGPMIGVSWYGGAAYCNWLSEREGIPRDQWCYEPNGKGEYAEGMRIRPDALKRAGYRLPTEAEWEYACRAGALTSRYYGHSIGLLGKYAWYNANSGEQARPCRSLRPNDLGLSDMLGNVYEWCQERYQRNPIQLDSNAQAIEHVNESFRLLRGGSFSDRPANVRSASRIWNAPSYHNTNNGFRPARTY